MALAALVELTQTRITRPDSRGGQAETLEMQSGVFQWDQFETHSHGTADAGAAFITRKSGSGSLDFNTFPSSTIRFTDTRTGFTGGNETRPVNAYVNYIIKY